MAYQALYRKYRPSHLGDVVGQDAVVETLKNAVKEKRVSHAYLFAGPRGTGKTSIAKLLAKMVNCLENQDGNPCNKCEICLKIDQKEVSDIIEIDAASNNGVDEIREIRNKANLSPSLCKYKVYIIDEVHMLSTGAFNALLKTLEEPPHHVIFILATTEIHKIPLTIISRCQRFDFKKITVEKLTERLKYIASAENIAIDDDAVKHIAEICDGGMRDSISLLDQLSGFQHEQITIDDVDTISGNLSESEVLLFIQNIFAGNHEYILEKIKIYNDEGKNLLKFVEKMIIYMRNILLFANAKDYFKKNYQNIEQYEAVYNEIKGFDIYQVIDELNTLMLDMKNNSAHQILLEIKMLKIMALFNNQAVEFHKTEKSCEEKVPQSKKDKPPKDEEKGNQEIPAEDPQPIKNNSENSKTDEKMQQFIEIRIHNTFHDSNKTLLSDLKEKWKAINQYTIDPQYADIASLLLDGELKAVGSRNIIVVYPYDSMAKRANDDLIMIEKLLLEALQTSYKFIAISNDEWLKESKAFLEKWKRKEKYDYIEEHQEELPEVVQQEANTVVDEALELFGDLVKFE